MYILIHILTSQPALIKLDNENIGWHRYTFTRVFRRSIKESDRSVASDGKPCLHYWWCFLFLCVFAYICYVFSFSIKRVYIAILKHLLLEFVVGFVHVLELFPQI